MKLACARIVALLSALANARAIAHACAFTRATILGTLCMCAQQGGGGLNAAPLPLKFSKKATPRAFFTPFPKFISIMGNLHFLARLMDETNAPFQHTLSVK